MPLPPSRPGPASLPSHQQLEDVRYQCLRHLHATHCKGGKSTGAASATEGGTSRGGYGHRKDGKSRGAALAAKLAEEKYVWQRNHNAGTNPTVQCARAFPPLSPFPYT